MDIYKKRTVNFVAALLAVLCVTVLFIRNNNQAHYPVFRENRSIRVRSLKGTGEIRLKGGAAPLEKISVFLFDDFFSLKLKKDAKVILEFGGNRDIYLKLAGPLEATGRILSPRMKKSLSFQKCAYENSRKAFFFFNRYAVFISFTLFLWVLFAYLKNRSLIMPYFAVTVSSFASFLLIRFAIDLFHFPFIKLTPLNFFLCNMILLGVSWILFDKNMFIPGLLRIKSRSTDLLMDAERLFREKKYKEGVLKLREVVRTDPDRYDIVKLVRVLETRYKDITG